MDIKVVKLELIEMLLQERKEDILIKIKALLDDSLSQNIDYSVLEERRAKYITSEEDTYSWSEIKKEIE